MDDAYAIASKTQNESGIEYESVVYLTNIIIVMISFPRQ